MAEWCVKIVPRAPGTVTVGAAIVSRRTTMHPVWRRVTQCSSYRSRDTLIASREWATCSGTAMYAPEVGYSADPSVLLGLPRDTLLYVFQFTCTIWRTVQLCSCTPMMWDYPEFTGGWYRTYMYWTLCTTLHIYIYIYIYIRIRYDNLKKANIENVRNVRWKNKIEFHEHSNIHSSDWICIRSTGSRNRVGRIPNNTYTYCVPSTMDNDQYVLACYRKSNLIFFHLCSIFLCLSLSPCMPQKSVYQNHTLYNQFITRSSNIIVKLHVGKNKFYIDLFNHDWYTTEMMQIKLVCSTATLFCKWTIWILHFQQSSMKNPSMNGEM